MGKRHARDRAADLRASFVFQRVNGIEQRGFGRWVIAEADADRRGKHEGQRDGAEREHRWRLRDRSQRVARADAQTDAEDAADH